MSVKESLRMWEEDADGRVEDPSLAWDYALAEDFAREHADEFVSDLNRRERFGTDHRGYPASVIRLSWPYPDDAVPVQLRSRTLSQRELSVRVERVMEHLRPEHRDLLLRTFWEHQRQADIAAEKGVTQQAVSKQLRTAYGQFKVALATWGIEVEDVALEDL